MDTTMDTTTEVARPGAEEAIVSHPDVPDARAPILARVGTCRTCRWCVPVQGAIDDTARCQHEDSPLAGVPHRLTEDETARWGCTLHETRP